MTCLASTLFALPSFCLFLFSYLVPPSFFSYLSLYSVTSFLSFSLSFSISLTDSLRFVFFFPSFSPYLYSSFRHFYFSNSPYSYFISSLHLPFASLYFLHFHLSFFLHNYLFLPIILPFFPFYYSLSLSLSLGFFSLQFASI